MRLRGWSHSSPKQIQAREPRKQPWIITMCHVILVMIGECDVCLVGSQQAREPSKAAVDHHNVSSSHVL